MAVVAALLGLIVVSLAWLAPRGAVLGGDAGALTGGGPFGQPGTRRWLAAGLVPVAAIAFAVVLDTGPWSRIGADHLRGRDFALIEREFLYRQRIHDTTIDLMRRGHRAEIQALRASYEDQIVSLRARYEEAWEAMTQNSEQLVRSIAQQFGLNPDFMAVVAGRESGFDPGIANADSGARGLFQFMPATWNQIGDQYRDRIEEQGLFYEPVTRDNQGGQEDPRNDARMNTVMGALLTLTNIELTQSDDPAILYLAHFAGAEMARYVAVNLEENPDELIRDVVRRIMPGFAELVIEQNAAAYEEETTVADFYQWSASRFAGIDSAWLEPPEQPTDDDEG